MQHSVSILSISSISALGSSQNEIWENYVKDHHCLSEKTFENFTAFVGELPEKDKKSITRIKDENTLYKRLDPTVLYALFVARKAIQKAGWKPKDNFGINMGSSRGATSLFEKYHQSFLDSRFAETLSSPTTTLGNISSWVAHDLQTQGPEVSHSITCSTALHALLNGIAWIQSGMSDKFLVGGSEAALTEFTIAQMKAMKIYATASSNKPFPCRAFDLKKKRNTMVIGEGASVVCLEKGIDRNALATIEGIGYATEILEHNISISTDGNCFQRSMKMALGKTDPDDVDVIVMHAPGTVEGDLSEFRAISTVFPNKTPFLTTNKWKLGHTFAASGMLSVELAILMLQHQKAISVPFALEQEKPKKIRKILVNAVGFGGNAVSVLLSK